MEETKSEDIDKVDAKETEIDEEKPYVPGE